MTESFSVESRLTLSTNVEAVLKQLIEQFEEFDKIVKDSQEILAGFAKETSEIGNESGAGLREAFAGLKIPQSVLSDLAEVCEFGKGFAGSSLEAAAAWKEIAAASKSIRNAPPIPVGSGNNTGGGSGGGGRRGGGATGTGEEGEGGGPSIFGAGDDYPNAVWQNQDFNTRSKYQEKLLSDEQKAVQGEIDARQRSEAKAAADKERADAKSFNDDYFLATRENLERNAKATAEERAAQRKFNDDYTLANRENRDFDIRNRKPKDEEHGISHREIGHAAIGLQIGGDAVTNKAEEAIMADFNYEHLLSIITGDTRVTPEQKQDLRETVAKSARNVPGSTRAEALEVFTDLKNTFGDFDEAKAELEPMLKLVTTLRMANLKQGGEGDMHQALSMARFIEDQGGAVDLKTGSYDQAKFDEIAHKAVSIYVATQGRVAPSDMLAFQKMARTGGMMMDDHALYGETPYFAQGFGASKLGTAIFSDVQVMLANRMTKKTADELGDFGMYETKHVVGKGNKAHQEWDQSTLKDADLLRHDPYAWIHDILGAQIALKLKVDDKTKEGQEAILMKLTEMAQRGTIAGLWGDVYRNYTTAQKEGRNIEAQNPDMAGHFLKEDPMAQLLVFKAAENELMVVIGDLLRGPALEMLKQLVESLHGLSDWAEHNKDTAKVIAETVASIGLFAKVFGGLAMAAFFIGPIINLIKGISFISGGLSALAAALVPFEAGGAAAAGLAGLEAGAAGLAATVAGGGVKSAIAGGALKSIMWGGPIAAVGAGVIGGFEGARMSGEDIAKHGAKGESPVMIDDFGNPIGYYQSKKTSPDSLVSPTASGPNGGANDPLHVVVTNQVSGNDIARGVASNIASKMNRPASGYTGSDTRMDPLPFWYSPAAN